MMKWLLAAWMLMAVGGSGLRPRADAPGGRWMLEATIPLSQVRTVTCSPEPGVWAAASAYQSWLYRDTTQVAESDLRGGAYLQFVDQGKTLTCAGVDWQVAQNATEASTVMLRLEKPYYIASAVILPGDTVMAALVRYAKDRGLRRDPPVRQTEPDNKVLLLDVRTGSVLHTLATDLPTAETMHFAAHGHLLASVHEHLRVWDMRTGATVVDQPIDLWAVLQPVAFSPDGRFFLTAGIHKGAAMCWRTDTWKRVWQGQLAGSGIVKLGFDGQGKLYFASKQGGLYATTFSAAGVPGSPVSIARGEVLDFAFDADGHRLYVAGGENVRVYRLN